MVEQWISEVKKSADFNELGMILIHNGMVRATSKEGKQVKGMHLTYDRNKLQKLIEEYSRKDGIVAIKAWINEGNLTIGDDIMYLLVAGRFRKLVLPVFEEVLSKIKNEIVYEKEFS
ncbi:MAG: molybdenum cofactor biosynthesis protein MoaE [Nitrospirae bacterium]|jgi:molybdopterin synthase catalytic subunit|nr:molybdenum cofactor biosynthesis protein MoaE [Nitrospirota bacterium]